MNVIELFSSDYSEARAKFLAACEAANAPVEHFRNPETGPSGEPLFTDVTVLGPDDAERVLLLCSGTHGVEGFAGSAIQTGLLRDGIAERLPDGVRLVMIHALNPFGFAHLRRTNEDNVDLNRNFIDHAVAHPLNPGYDDLAEIISPKTYSRTLQPAPGPAPERSRTDCKTRRFSAMDVNVGFLAADSWEPEAMQARTQWLRQNDPVRWSEKDGLWLISRYEEVEFCSKHQELFTSAEGVRYGNPAKLGLIDEAEPRHGELRGLIIPEARGRAGAGEGEDPVPRDRATAAPQGGW